MIKENKLLFLVFLYSLSSFIVDFLVGDSESWFLILLTDLPILAIIFLAMKGQRWAYVLMVVYYFIRSVNYYFPEFYFFTKNGLNFEFSIRGIMGVNLVSLLCFLMLLYDLKSKFDNSLTKIIRRTIIVGLIVIFFLELTSRIEPVPRPKQISALELSIDKTTKYGRDYFIDIPDDWTSFVKTNENSLFALSPYRDSQDEFSEGFFIKIYHINDTGFSAEIVTKKLYQQTVDEIKQATYDEPYSYYFDILETQQSGGFYTLHYSMNDEQTFLQYKLFCKVEGRKAYLISFCDQEDTFSDNLKNVFEPIFQTFRTE